MTSSIDPNLTPADAPGEPSWWIADGVPGNGARPEWMPEKFKSVSDIAKSYSELEKRVGSAPKEYDTSKGESWLDPDYAPFQDMLDLAKSKHVPQEVLDRMFDSVGKYLNEFARDDNAERAKLGDKAEERLNVLDNWVKSNFTPETYAALVNSMSTADAVIAIEEVRSKMIANATSIPNSNHESTGSMPSLQDIQSEMNKNLEKYKTDPTYRREMQAKMELAAKGSGFEEKRPY